MALLVDLASAKRELRVLHDAEDTEIERKLGAAQEQAQAFLNRNVYADTYELDEAVIAAPEVLRDATLAYEAAMDAAGLLETQAERDLAYADARAAMAEAQEAYRMARRGMVVNESIRTAILLTAGSLWEHRGDEDSVQGVPPAARAFLWPYRIGLGI